LIWSGGWDGVLTLHACVFARDERTGSSDLSRLVIGIAMSPRIDPEDVGRPAMVEKVAGGVRAAMKDAGITDPREVQRSNWRLALV
jgi:barbiturase